MGIYELLLIYLMFGVLTLLDGQQKEHLACKYLMHKSEKCAFDKSGPTWINTGKLELLNKQLQ